MELNKTEKKILIMTIEERDKRIRKVKELLKND